MQDRDDEDIALASATDKGKGKEREDFGLDDNRTSSPEHLETMMYPPISEDAEETRRVEENLRRWEVAERQRRKAVRDSQSQSVPSLVSDVSKRASLLFSGRKTKQNSITMRNGAALQSQDSLDVVLLTHPAHHTQQTSSSSPTQSEHERDPFANPSAPASQIAVSPFDDVYATPQDPTTPPSAALNSPTKNVPGRHGIRRPPSPPRPIDLPPPRSPPPIDEEEGGDSTERPIVVRWWHDWLCGCSEGPDRGGDFQAGHTNPLE